MLRPSAPGVAKRDPKDGAPLLRKLNHGISAARSEPEQAIRELTEVLAQDPGLVMARRARAVAYEASGQFDKAIAEIRVVEKGGRLSAEDGVSLGDNLRFSGRLDEAMAVLERTARENPRFGQPWLSIAEIHIKRKNNAEAKACYERVLALVPDHIEALRGLGDLALIEEKIGRGGDALRAHPRHRSPGRGSHDEARGRAHADGPGPGGGGALPERGGA